MRSFWWSQKALRDLTHIYVFIAADSTVYANRLIRLLIRNAYRAEEFPASGRLVPELDDPSYREFIVGNYRLIYRISADAVGVVAVVHGSRHFASIKDFTAE